MGILRVYLALCVIASHTNSFLPWPMHAGNQAVQIFYAISGFYMAMVLSSRYSTLRDFYISRFLRIYPTYWVVLVATLIFCVGTGLFFYQWHLLRAYVNDPWKHNGMLGIVLAAVSNITLIGQDWVMFLSHDRGHALHLTKNFSADSSPLWGYLLVPQCWSVGVELTFYACVPFLNKLQSRSLLIIALLSFGGRFYAYWHWGLAHDPWDVRFFPFEISMFIFGMLGYRLYVKIVTQYSLQKFHFPSIYFYIAAAIPLLFLLQAHAKILHYLIKISGSEIGISLASPAWIILLPILFFFFGTSPIDRVIGELSYPIYLVQDIAIIMARALFLFLNMKGMLGFGSALFSILLAVLLYRLFVMPLDKKRHLLAHTISNGTS